MKTLLLLAGRSTRFWPLSEKTLFPICGKTLLEHQVDCLKKAGIDEGDIMLVGGAHNLREAKDLFPNFEMVEQENLELGMMGALLSALPECETDSVMIVSGNDVIDPEGYKNVAKAIEEKGIEGALLAREVDRYFPGGYLSVENNRILSIVEKPGEGKEPSNLVNIVAHAHESAAVLLEALRSIKNQKDDGYECALDALFKDHHYRAVPYKGYWQPVKYPWHLLHLLPHFLGELKPKIHKSASVHPSAVISGDVVIEEGARVMAHATIVGPCYIGKNSIVANSALVRGSSIGDDCIAGYATEVKGSILHSHVWTHMNYVGDSIVGRNVSFGGGTLTGNLRLDEGEITSVIKGEKIPTGLTKFGAVIGNDVRIGIHCSLNPGIKIGRGTLIASAAVLTEDIPDESYVVMKKGEVDIRPNRSPVATPEDREVFRANLKPKN